jgi:hypothetical protein
MFLIIPNPDAPNELKMSNHDTPQRLRFDCLPPFYHAERSRCATIAVFGLGGRFAVPEVAHKRNQLVPRHLQVKKLKLRIEQTAFQFS